HSKRRMVSIEINKSPPRLRIGGRSGGRGEDGEEEFSSGAKAQRFLACNVGDEALTPDSANIETRGETQEGGHSLSRLAARDEQTGGRSVLRPYNGIMCADAQHLRGRAGSRKERSAPPLARNKNRKGRPSQN